jgi:uncharacterized membrane protein
MNPPNKANTLRLYALGLLLVGLASVLYNAEADQIGWYAKGKTGLIAGGIGAVLALVCSVFAAKDKLWAHYAGAILAFMFLIVGFKNGFVISRSISMGVEPAFLWYKAAVFGAVAIVSLISLMPILIYLRRERI